MHNKRLGYLVYFFIFVSSISYNALKGAEYTPPPSPGSEAESSAIESSVVKNKKCRHTKSQMYKSNRQHGLTFLRESEQGLAALNFLTDEQYKEQYKKFFRYLESKLYFKSK